MSSSLWPRGLQHSRLPCPSLSPRVCSNSFPQSQWCHSTILSSAALFFWVQSFPASRVFSNESALRIRWPKHWSFSFSKSVLPMYIQDWFPLRLTGLIFFQSKELLRVFSSTTIRKHSVLSLLHCPALTSVHSMWSSTFFFFSFFLI